ncbi:hypothetical protein, conserved [Leishmania tarentolae]|uniref:Uncharacterized protein n=1 Tax=Leishmania tarentolae TaxID=5689 RepID=A0A640K8J2_LEITA|nr:hypothetical protein, conserved [Leishmania tarentolae]
MAMLGNNKGTHPMYDDTVLVSPNASPNLQRARAMDHCSAKTTEAPPLADLLTRASEAIRDERWRADLLEKENSKLHAQLDGVRMAYQLAATRQARQSPQTSGTVTALCKAENGALFAYVRDQLIGPDKHRSSNHEDCSGKCESISRTRLGGRQLRSNIATSSLASTAARDPSRGVITALESASPKKTVPHTSVTREARGAHGHMPATLQSRPLNPEKEHAATSLPGGGGHKGDGHAQVTEGNSDGADSPMHWMARRLLRALAPRPTNGVVGDIVHTMVTALQQDVQAELNRPREGGKPAPSRTRGFALVRLRPCVYRLLVGSPTEVKAAERAARSTNRSTRPLAPRLPSVALHHNEFLLYSTHTETSIPARPRPSTLTDTVLYLTIDTGTLRVARGGGHVDFIDYLERRLQIKLYTAARPLL